MVFVNVSIVLFKMSFMPLHSERKYTEAFRNSKTTLIVG